MVMNINEVWYNCFVIYKFDIIIGLGYVVIYWINCFNFFIEMNVVVIDFFQISINDGMF